MSLAHLVRDETIEADTGRGHNLSRQVVEFANALCDPGAILKIARGSSVGVDTRLRNQR